MFDTEKFNRALSHKMGQNCVKYNFYIFDTLDSTNSYAKRLAQDGESSDACIIAASQSAGRGRLGREFYSPDGGLYLSLLLHGPVALSVSKRLTAAAAVAVGHSIEALCGCDWRIKWVNDIFINSRKVCGILCEGGFSQSCDMLDYVIIGIGVNCSEVEFPESLKNTAGTLGGAEGIREELACEILCNLQDIIQDAQSCAFLEEYRLRSMLIGERVRVLSGQGYDADVLDIDSECRLVIRRDDGSIVSLDSGDVSVRRL
jgi:BirA family biotin operon repressor/biotin-[acetyl-CoA-carboxylase] ligase